MAVSTNQVIEHAIGPTGDLVLKLVEGTVTLRGVDGDTARVAISAPGYDGRIGIERNPGGLQVRIPEKFFSVGWLGFDFHGLGSRTSVELDVDVPRGATVTIDGASTRVNGDGLVGEQRVHLVSGDLRLDRAGGRITVDGVSGRVAVRAARDVALAVRTVSGDISVTAPRIAELRVNTLSAGVDAAGALADDGRYRVETVSGRVTIATDSPLRVEARTMTGSVTSEHSAESRMDDGRRILSVGQGGPIFAFHSMSGSLRVTALRGSPWAAGTSARTAEAEPGMEPEPDAPAAEVPTTVDDRLSILRALERGEIDVDEASRRLALLDASRG